MPFNSAPAPAGHNSRNFDIERTAEEVRAKYLVTHAAPGASETWRMLYTTLLNPRLSDAAKVQYALTLPERKNFAWSNERTAKLTGSTPRTVERLFKELARQGAVKSTRHRNKPSSREFLAPKSSILVAATELLSRIEGTSQETTNLSFVNHQTTETSFQETTNLSARNDKNVAQPLSLLPLSEEEREREAAVGGGRPADAREEAISSAEAAFIQVDEIRGPTWVLPYRAIDLVAKTLGYSIPEARDIAEAQALSWVVNYITPDDPLALFTAGLKAIREKMGSASYAEALTARPKAPRKKATQRAPAYTEQFEIFYSLYPRGEGKGAAATAFSRLSADEQACAITGVRKQRDSLARRASDPKGNFCPLPATWLNQRRFDDTPANGGAKPANSILLKKAGEADWVWRERIGIEIRMGKVTQAAAEQAGWSPL